MTEAPRVLIVEDQYFVAMDCELHLSEAGFDCIGFATTAADAVELAGRDHPDLIIMDIRLASSVDGVQAAIEIYERFGIRSIFSSGHADARVRREAERAHPLGWVDKPYTGEELVHAARAAVVTLSSALVRTPEAVATTPAQVRTSAVH